MPFTPFHCGPVLLIGLYFFEFLDLPSLLVASVVPDMEGLYIVVLRPHMTHHGPIHTYIVASIMGIIVAVAMYSLERLTGKAIERIGLQVSHKTKTLYSSLIGAYSHIFLDSFLYPEMNPLYPFLGNPFVEVASEPVRYMAVYGLCTISFLVSLIVYFRRTAPTLFRPSRQHC